MGDAADREAKPAYGGVITALRPTQRDPMRVTVKVGRRSVGTLAQTLADGLGLRPGVVWTEALAASLDDALAYDKAWRAATRGLARRAMSSGMVRQKLRRLDPPADAATVDRVLERLVELGLLDDEAFGRALIRDVTRAKPAGPALLRQKLYAKGLDQGVIDRLVAEATADDEAQADAAVAFARKRAASMRKLDAATRDRRLYGQLARRGFTPDDIRRAMAAVRAGGDDDEPTYE
ncbi:MAG: regulatory protein RecX [Planctomycetota bacterium]